MSAPLSVRSSLARVTFLALILLGFLLRVATLDRLGLAYDEAASALMARATPAEIIAFHWDAAFEHPPVWVLLVHLWSAAAGQHEFALRWLPALAGVLLIPLTWRIARTLWPESALLPVWAALFVTSAPVLVYYSQEARMYTLVIALLLLLLLLTLRLDRAALDHHPVWPWLLAFWLTAWTLFGLHYYAVVGVALMAAGVGLQGLVARRLAWGVWVAAFGGAVLPLLGWMAFSPGFQATLEVVLDAADSTPITWYFFLTDLWRELSFGAIRWQPPQAVWGYALAPVMLLGAGVILLDRTPDPVRQAGRWIVLGVALVPILSGALILRTLSPRYILWVAPMLYLLAAVAVVYTARLHRLLAAVVAGVVLGVALLGLAHYFGPYRKSEYREMVHAMRQVGDPTAEAIILEAPRQHLLAKYYLPAAWTLYPMPTYPLPAYWPVTAPVLVPEDEDDTIQQWLVDYQGLWAFYAGENEVDPGEFLAKYLTAVAYRVDCSQWLDVRTCHYLSPHHWPVTDLAIAPADFGGELRLEGAAAALYAEGTTDTALLVRLDWLAQQKPTRDYKVTLRLVDAAGNVLAQTDDFPIGPLIPPTGWNQGDAKPGYAAVTLPAALPAGDYWLQAGVYDPATLAAVPGVQATAAPADTLTLAQLAVDDTMALLPVTPP